MGSEDEDDEEKLNGFSSIHKLDIENDDEDDDYNLLKLKQPLQRSLMSAQNSSSRVRGGKILIALVNRKLIASSYLMWIDAKLNCSEIKKDSEFISSPSYFAQIKASSKNPLMIDTPTKNLLGPITQDDLISSKISQLRRQR